VVVLQAILAAIARSAGKILNTPFRLGHHHAVWEGALRADLLVGDQLRIHRVDRRSAGSRVPLDRNALAHGCTPSPSGSTRSGFGSPCSQASS
jgi:hypothetical protein